MLSRVLFILFNAMIFLSLIFNDIPFTPRRLLMVFLGLGAVGLSIIGVLLKYSMTRKIRKIPLVSWQWILLLLIVLPLLRTSLSITPIEMKLFLFSAVVTLAASQYLQPESGKAFTVKVFYLSIWVLWILLILQGILGEVDPNALVRTDAGLSDFKLKFAFSNVFSSANHVATLYGFVTLLILNKSEFWLIKYLLLGISLYVFLALDANVALFSLLVVVFFSNILFRFRWSLVLVTIFYPLIFIAYAAVLFAFLGVQSEVLISMNNRLPMWAGLLAEFQSWRPLQIVLGQAWYSNYIETTKWIYTDIFGQYYSGLKTAHSTSLQLIMDTGVVGFMLYVFFIIKYMCRLEGGLKKYKRYFIPISFLLLAGISESLFGVYMPTLFLLLSMVVVLMSTKTLVNYES